MGRELTATDPLEIRGGLKGKWRIPQLIALAELLAMSVWFAATAAVLALTTAWGLSGRA